MTGSSASNLGYGNHTPFTDTPFANSTNSHNASSFTSSQTPTINSSGMYSFKGGFHNVSNNRHSYSSNKIRKNIKNISRMYKNMKPKSMKRMKRNLYKKISRSMKLLGGRKRKSRINTITRTRKQRKQKGGYSQYQNNLPMTSSYSVGGILSAKDSAMSTPPPTQTINGGNCVDNYNHFTHTGFPSKGH